MEADDQLLAWSLENKKALNLEVTQNTWPSEVNLPLFDYSIQIGENCSRVGRGVDQVKKTAFLKALSEAFERLAMDQNGLSCSNGVAAHSELELAKRNAKKELIERDAFFSCYYGQLGFKRLERFDERVFQGPIEPLKNRDLLLRVYHVAESSGYTVLLSVVSGLTRANRPIGLCLSLSCEDSFERALKKLLLESLAKGMWMSTLEPGAGISLAEFHGLESPNLLSHQDLGLNCEYASCFLSQMDSMTQQSVNELQPLDGFEYQELKLKVNDQFSPPLHVIRCLNPALQKPFWGQFREDKLRGHRVRDIRGCRELLPHPFA